LPLVVIVPELVMVALAAEEYIPYAAVPVVVMVPELVMVAPTNSIPYEM
jgi:hypothetical protein